MNRIVETLMKRDGMTYNEASDIFQNVRDLVLEAAIKGSYSDVEEIFYECLGLEIDYLEDLL